MIPMLKSWLSLRPWETIPELRRTSEERREQLWREAAKGVRRDGRFWLAAAFGLFFALMLAFAADGLFESPINPGLPKGFFTVASGVVVILFGSVLFTFVARLIIRERLQQTLQRFCPACGHDTATNPSGVCPKCGRTVDAKASQVSPERVHGSR